MGVLSVYNALSYWWPRWRLLGLHPVSLRKSSYRPQSIREGLQRQTLSTDIVPHIPYNIRPRRCAYKDSIFLSIRQQREICVGQTKPGSFRSPNGTEDIKELNLGCDALWRIIEVSSYHLGLAVAPAVVGDHIHICFNTTSTRKYVV